MTICNRLKLAKMEIGLKRFEEIKQDIKRISARNPHELMRATEVSFIRDCAEMAARASLFREESRWGLYHYRADFLKNNSDWFCHAHLKKMNTATWSVSKANRALCGSD